MKSCSTNNPIIKRNPLETKNRNQKVNQPKQKTQNLNQSLSQNKRTKKRTPKSLVQTITNNKLTLELLLIRKIQEVKAKIKAKVKVNQGKVIKNLSLITRLKTRVSVNKKVQ